MTVRIGFLGAGLIATYHSKMLRSSGEDITWSGVYDPDPDRAEAFAAATGARVCAAERDVIEASDAVYICTWPAEHRRLLELALDGGVAVFCEKPLAVDAARAATMTE